MEDVAIPTDAAKLLSDYTVVPVAGEAMVALFGHVKCTHTVRTTFPLTVAFQVALALEHHLKGCAVPTERRRR